MAEGFPSKPQRGTSFSSCRSDAGPKRKIKAKPITSKTVQWPALPPNKLGLISPAKKTRISVISELVKDKPISRKAMVVHEDIIRSRDLVFEVFLEHAMSGVEEQPS